MRRSNSYDKIISKKLQDFEYRQVFLLTLMENDDGLSLEEALRDVIRIMGIQEFSKLVKVPRPNVSEFLAKKRKLKPETLDVYLKPFGLRTELIAVKLAS